MENMTMKGKLLLVLSVWILSIPAYSDSGGYDLNVGSEGTSNRPSSQRFSYSVALDFISLDSSVATSRGLNDSAVAVQLAGIYRISRYFEMSAGFSTFNLEDDNQFTGLVVDNDGFVRVAESESRGTTLFSEAYFLKPAASSGDVFYRVGLGAASIANARRRIPDCDNCETFEFDLQGGGYWLTSVGVRFGAKSGIGLTARGYLSGDFDDSVLLWWQARL